MCATCEKVILEEAEINKKSEEKSILCDSCGTWWYLPCAGLTLCDKPLDFWVCPRCLIDVKSSLDDVNFRNDSESDDDHIGSNLNQAIDDEEDVNVGASTSACEGESHVKTTNVCSVCLLESIPVGVDHICPICRNAVHAWCCSHEKITNSRDLICNYCADE